MANEQELIEYYEGRKGDTSAWGGPIKANVRKGGSVVFSIRLAPEELEAFRQLAENLGTTPSEFIRSAALNALTEPRPVSSVTLRKTFVEESMGDTFVDAGLGTQTRSETKSLLPAQSRNVAAGVA